MESLNNLAWLLATHPIAGRRDGPTAVKLAERSSQLCKDQQAGPLDTLAAAYAESGRFGEAVATARKALELATEQKQLRMVNSLRERISLYEAGKAFHQTVSR